MINNINYTLSLMTLLLLINFNGISQNNDYEYEYDLFSISDNNDLKSKYFNDSIKGEILVLDEQKLKHLIHSNRESFIFKIPMKDTVASFRLKKSNFIVAGAKGKTMDAKYEVNLESRGLHYWGTSTNDTYADTVIAFSFFRDKVFGLFSSRMGNYMLHKFSNQSNVYAFYKDIGGIDDLDCATDESLNIYEEKIKANFKNSTESLLDFPIHISMNANNCVINNVNMGNGSIQGTIDYVLSHFNLYALIFANEEITIKVSEVVLEDYVQNGTGEGPCYFAGPTSSDLYGPGMLTIHTCTNGDVQPPYCCDNPTSNYMSQFQEIVGDSYVGDYAYLYVGSRCGPGAGRAAGIGNFCDMAKTQRMAVGLAPIVVDDDYDLPDLFPRLGLFVHEMGHLFGATHEVCSNDVTSFTLMMNGGQVGACYFIDQNYIKGFGPMKGNDIRTSISNNKNCFTQSNTCEQNELYIFHRIEDLGGVDYSAFYKATSIVADNLILNNSEALYKAETSIELIPGFEVEQHSNFEALIGACNNTGTMNFDSLSKEGRYEEKTFKIIPNPVDNFINVLGDLPITSVQIYNFNGIVLIEKSFKADQTSVKININELKKGVYFVKIFSFKKEEQIQIIKI